MADRISDLPDAILCNILSLLPAKEAVATSVLSRRWKRLWRSVPIVILDYEDHSYSKANYFRFVQSVNNSLCDSDKPLQRFRLSCRSSHYNGASVTAWLAAAAKRSVEHLDLSLSSLHWIIGLPSAFLKCNSLVDLKMTDLNVKLRCSSVRLPSLRILHLNSVNFLEPMHFAQFLRGCPNIEDLNVENVSCIYDENGDEFYDEIEDNMDEIQAEFRRLPKLIRAHILKRVVPFEVVNNVEFLSIDWIRCTSIEYNVPMFHNLTHIEFGYLNLERASERLKLLKVLEHCPKVQILVVDKKDLKSRASEEADWSYPQSVPGCISLHLKTCRLTNYIGSKGEFQFARYIMQNASQLQTITICTGTTSNQGEKREMMEKLSSWTMRSATCKLSFE